jgi:hypothetical protein
MSESFVNQITLDCLLNKQMYNNQIRSKKAKQINNEERKFYRKRIFNLFKEIINGNKPEDLSPDVKYAYDNFMTTSIQYFKTIDNNDIIQSEYKDIIFSLDCSNNTCIDSSSNYIKNLRTDNLEADLLLTRSIKLDVPTLDKYVTKTRNKKKEEIVLPKQKEINLNDPQLKTKGIKKNNINIIYEEQNKKN